MSDKSIKELEIETVKNWETYSEQFDDNIPSELAKALAIKAIRLLIENGKLTPKESGWQHAYPEAELVAFWEQVINELESL